MGGREKEVSYEMNNIYIGTFSRRFENEASLDKRYAGRETKSSRQQDVKYTSTYP